MAMVANSALALAHFCTVRDEETKQKKMTTTGYLPNPANFTQISGFIEALKVSHAHWFNKTCIDLRWLTNIY